MINEFKIGDTVINTSRHWHSGNYNINKKHNNSSSSHDFIGVEGVIREVGYSTIRSRKTYLVEWFDDFGMCSKSFNQLKTSIQTHRHYQLEKLLSES